MTSRTALIVDDEKLARNRIRSYLEKRTEFAILDARNGLDALAILETRQVDLVFLDIQMPGFSGFDVLAQIERRDFQIIFQTAYDEFAIRAFDEHACDYLLKPFTIERFNKAVDRALSLLGQTPVLSCLEKSLRTREGYLAKICVKIAHNMHIIPTDEFIAFVSRDHYTLAFSKEREFVLDLSLNHLEERLDPQKFQRLHRNNIVRVSEISAIVGGENMQVHLKNGTKLPVSRNNRTKLKIP